MECAVAESTASPRDLAYLRDRVSMHHDHYQTRGTQHTAYGDGGIRLWSATDPDTPQPTPRRTRATAGGRSDDRRCLDTR